MTPWVAIQRTRASKTRTHYTALLRAAACRPQLKPPRGKGKPPLVAFGVHYQERDLVSGASPVAESGGWPVRSVADCLSRQEASRRDVELVGIVNRPGNSSLGLRPALQHFTRRAFACRSPTPSNKRFIASSW